MLSFQSKQSSEVVRVDSQIQAVEKQIKQERERLAMEAGGALNSISSEYRALELQAKFAEEAYQGAMGALENTRIEAARKLKQLSILQSPTTPEYAEKPDRIYDITVFIILALFFTLIVNMLILIVKDHRD
ncbi:hypothetical protein [Salinicola tamaricis]|uniref:hypothetical protein n=1 Tax=Salinicola tamaricis TaxID=1771309 RepID=UPI001F5DF1FE|nr:hypothetical protein [Salinicola tamaricis]